VRGWVYSASFAATASYADADLGPLDNPITSVRFVESAGVKPASRCVQDSAPFDGLPDRNARTCCGARQGALPL